jgi:hypothetical protein
MVVAPASVRVNWLVEIETHSWLPATRIHGPDRQDTLQAWVACGGVAVTTYRMLSTLSLPAGFGFQRRNRSIIRPPSVVGPHLLSITCNC